MSHSSTPLSTPSFDAFIQASLDKWPNVPTLFGYLSLNADGLWRLHMKKPIFDAARHHQDPGEGMSNQGLVRFINQYYFRDERGAYFFQNGPQRVYVALLHTPWVLHLDPNNQHNTSLFTHTHQEIQSVSAWYLDEQGLFYAHSNLGLALIHSRDLPHLLTLLGFESEQQKTLHHPIYGTAPFTHILQSEREGIGGYIAYPKPNDGIACSEDR